MARRRGDHSLNVYLNSRLVGRLSQSTSNATSFQYDTQWLDWEFAQPVSLSLPLREDRYIGAQVVAVFDNLLPDNDSIRRRIASRVRAEGIDAYSLLSRIGRDCVGALQFVPEGTDPGRAGGIDGEPLSDREIESIIRDLGTIPLGLREDQDFRISLAGAQEKTALLRWKGQWLRPIGSTPTTHILKPQIGRLPNGIDLSSSVENEYLCLKLTGALGLPSAAVEIQDFEGRRVLVVERFDRQVTRDDRLLRRPQEDFCQALSVASTLKYEADGGPGIPAILDLLKASDDPLRDQALFMRAQVVFWLLGATDGHAKNFSIQLYPGGRFRLAPLYDVVSAQPSLDAAQISHNKMKLSMAIGANRYYVVDRIQPRHFLQTAAAMGIEPATRQAFAELVAMAPSAIATTEAALPDDFPKPIAHSIISGFKDRLSKLEVFLGHESPLI